MVQTENLGRIIDEHPFFQGINETLRTLLTGCARNEVFQADEFILREGQKADKFFLIRAGTVVVEVDLPGKPPIIVETVLDGEVLGWSWIVPPHRTTFAARAHTLVRALSFDAACLRKKMEADPALGYEVMRRFMPVMAHRLQSARLQMLDLYGPPAETPRKAIKPVPAVKDSKGTNRKADAKLAKPEKPLKETKAKKDKKSEKKQKKAG